MEHRISMSGRLFGPLAVFAAVAAAPAWAVDSQVTFTGRINIVQGAALPGPWSAVQVGDTWQLSMCFDPSTASICDSTTTGCYPAVHTARLQIGSTVVTQSGPGTGFIEVIHDGTNRSGYVLRAAIAPNLTATVALSGAPGVLGGIELLGCEDLPPLDAWTIESFTLETNVAAASSASGRVQTLGCEHVIGCTPCPRGCVGDYNGVNGADGDDVIAFFADWDANLPCADVNRSGGVDGDDVIRFFRAWDSGRCCPPPPDHNGDGRVTREDLCEFQADFVAGYPCADANDDGQTDAADVLAFVTMYEAAGGPGPMVGADFNADGHVTECDRIGFHEAFQAGQLAADANGDCAIDVTDAVAFASAFGAATPWDWNGNGAADCGDPRLYLAELRAGVRATDLDCDGATDAADANAFLLLFGSVYGGPTCPTGADFDLSGAIDCADIGAFVAAFNASDARTDYNGDGVFTGGDLDVYGRMYLDWNRDGSLGCADRCGYLTDFAAGVALTDMDCDGSVDVTDASSYLNFFQLLYQGPPCPVCP